MEWDEASETIMLYCVKYVDIKECVEEWGWSIGERLRERHYIGEHFRPIAGKMDGWDEVCGVEQLWE